MPAPSNTPRPTMAAMWINDFDLTRIGVTVTDVVDNHRAGLSFPGRTTALPGRVGTVALAREFESTPRRITVEADQVAASSTQIISNVDDLKLRAYAGEIELRFDDDQDRVFFARCEDFRATLNAPAFRKSGQVRHRVRMTFLCQDPLSYSRNSSVVGFSTAKAEVPLGSAISTPTLLVHGPSTASGFTILLKDFAQNTVSGFKLNGAAAVLSSTEAITIDSEKSTITHTDGTNLIGILTSTSAFPFFDPQNGGGSTGPWPTIEIDSTGVACEARFRKAFL